MAIVKTVNFYSFERAFKEAGRGNQFSYDGLKILFDYLENLSDDLGEPIELDVINLCSDYTEMTIVEVLKCYDDLGFSVEQLADLEITEDDILEALHEHTMVCGSYYCEDAEDIVIVFQSF